MPEVAIAAAQSPALSRLQFMRRFTQAERIAIRAARASDPVIDDFMGLLEMTDEVRLDDPDTIAGIQFMVSQSLLDPARADEILNS